MRRREFITLLGGAAAAAAWPFAATGQQGMPVIGWLSGRNAETDAQLLAVFREGLAPQGYVEGRNLKVEFRYTDGRTDLLPTLIADLVKRSVSAIVAAGTTSGQGPRLLKEATATIPIIFNTGADPIALGLVSS